jgi:Fe-S cluster assembly iron-binding protein IscA
MKSEREIENLIKRTEQEIKTIQPTIKSMGSQEARALVRLEGKIEAFKEVLENEKKEYVNIDVSINDHGTHTIATNDEDIITSDSTDMSHIDSALITPTNKTEK